MLLATGWAGLASSMRDLERTETVGKLKEGTATMIDRSMDGLSKVSCSRDEVVLLHKRYVVNTLCQYITVAYPLYPF